MNFSVFLSIAVACVAVQASAATKLIYESQNYSQTDYWLGDGAVDGSALPFNGSYDSTMSIRFELELDGPLVANALYLDGPTFLPYNYGLTILSISDGVYDLTDGTVNFQTDSSGSIVDWWLSASYLYADSHSIFASSSAFDSVQYHNVQGYVPSDGSVVFSEGSFLCCTAEVSSAVTNGLGTWTVVTDPPAQVPLPATGLLYGLALAGAAAARRPGKRVR